MKVYKRELCSYCEGRCQLEKDGFLSACPNCDETGHIFIELSPAELETLNLAYAAVVEEIRKKFKIHTDCQSPALAWVERLIKQHLSDPDKYKKLLVQAKAWKDFRETLASSHFADSGSLVSDKHALIKHLDGFLAEARRSLGLEKEEEEDAR